MNQQELRRLIDALLDGEITEADFLLLEAELSVDAELRREYIDRVKLDMLLETELTGAPVGSPPEYRNPRPRLVHRWWLPVVAACTAVAVTALIMVSSTRRGQAPTSIARADSDAAAEKQAAGYGVIVGQDGAAWRHGGRPASGALIPTGDLSLSAGVLQLELFSGVSLVVEAPAEFSVQSPMHMVVHGGKISAHVPEPAHGFRISTRDGEVVDLGTDFAVDVTSEHSELHVLDGEVELQSRGKATRRLTMGQGVRMSRLGHTDLPADGQRFLGHDDLAGRLESAMRSKRSNWVDWTEQLRGDSRVVALYQTGVSPSSGRHIPNRANASSRASEGAIVAATRATDRWQYRDGALNFSPTGSRVRLTIPGRHRSISLMCWVKINSLDRWYNSLFLTDGHEQGEPHWQIMDDGRLFFSVKKRDKWDASKGEKDKHVFFSPSFWNTSLSGQWLMIATVYDVDRKRVTHFLNGDVLSEESIPDEYLVEQVQIGNASICNWSLPERGEPRFAVRNLNGSLDEFVLFSAALSQEEVKELYTHGKP